MSDSDKELENQILEAGEQLTDPPSSLDELLLLLDKLFVWLIDVDQSPHESMQTALSPLMKALVAGKLFKHSDDDVRVAVAACISEITRITAPEAPYDDDHMKEVFKLIVSSFANLPDYFSRSYSKRISILETVAKVRSCVVMLDLECDALLIEMFQLFLKAIRDFHPENVLSSMEKIMTLVLEESEEIPPKMFSPILHYVREDDEVPQVARGLAERVLSNSASKLKKYLTEAVKLSGVSLDKYSKIVASICEGTFSALQHDQLVENEKEDSQGHLEKEAEVEDKQEVIATPERTDAPKDESGKSGVSNGVAQHNNSSVDTESIKKQDDTNAKDDNPCNTDLDNTSEEKPDVEHQPQEKDPSSAIQVDSSKTSDIKEETEPGALLESKDVLSLRPDDSTVKAAISSENDKETSVQALPSKTSADETADVSSPSRGEDIVEESRPKKTANDKETNVQALPSKTSADETANVSSPSRAEDIVEESRPKKTANDKETSVQALPSKTSADETANVSSPSRAEDIVEESRPKKTANDKETNVQALPSKTSADETANVSSPSRAEDIVEESRPKKTANDKETNVQALPSKTSADETANVSSPSRAEDLVEENRPKKTANQKKNKSLTKEAKPLAASATEEASEEPNTSEAKVTKNSRKKVASSSKTKCTVPPKKGTSETKAAKQSEKKVVESENVQESSKPKEEKKKPGRGKAMDEDSLDTSSGDSEKPAVSSVKSASKSKKEVKQPIEGSPNTNTKRKRSLSKEKASDLQSHGEDLVGSRGRVWWPIDKAYYKGVVNSYDSAKKKHLVIYDDGDQEILNLKTQKWHFLDESETEGEEAADQTVHEKEASREPQRKKAKTGKQSKMESSGKKGGGAGSSKLKAAPASKSGKKSKDEKTESKPKDPKEASREEEEEDSSDELSEEEEIPKTVGKSGTSKSKKEISKSGTSKGSSKTTTTPKSKPGGPSKSSSAKGKAAKGKANSTPASKGEESDAESESEETPKAPEPATKGKPVGSGKSQAKSGKKRKR
ncbi:PREDICTED: treacle protein-like isoform X1 [Brassica oleracea var. oleracea]|uniref:Tudor domain-containing protein n=1 Tax=Brassica oleracea var. oleracea TaxID=109376 RepID=A0A0D3DHA0_BRAOL|nr:PREDICTED: treacle protein-like isoform X1 [Brassica oleracea var. oleracea]